MLPATNKTIFQTNEKSHGYCTYEIKAVNRMTVIHSFHFVFYVAAVLEKETQGNTPIFCLSVGHFINKQSQEE